METLEKQTLQERATRLGEAIETWRKRLEEHGVLDGQARLEADRLKVEQARLHALVSEMDDTDNEARATMAANLKALELQANEWFAQIDRHFKA